MLFQVCLPEPSIDDKETEMKVNELVNRINQQFGSLSYTPVHFHQRHLGDEEYFALLSVASVYVNTVERDSIPAVCLDYVICQDGLDEEQCGVLILSKLTTLADYLPTAEIVNPWHTIKVAEALREAVLMRASDRKTRITNMMTVIKGADAKNWAPNVLALLQNTRTCKTPLLDRNTFKQLYQQARRRIFFLDYDGTLTPIVTRPEDATPSGSCLDTLSTLTKDHGNQVYVISGRTQDSLMAFLGTIPELGLSAEHGSFLRHCHQPTWSTTVTEPSTSSWRDKAMSVFSHFTDRTPGSHIEEKALSLTWHYRRADPDLSQYQAADCVESLSGLFDAQRIDILRGKKNVEVRLATANKGHIVRSILEESEPFDLVVCVGDDTTDEDMFAVLKDHQNAITCTVGPANKHTIAKYHVPNSDHLLSLFQFALH